MKTLTEIANGLELDKGTLESPSWRAQFPEHRTMGYTEVYERYMASARDDACVRLLEIGVADCRFPLGSLRMWREYFPRATIAALDCFANWPAERVNRFVAELVEMRVELACGDQGKQETYDRLRNFHYDFIIEDGSHRPEDMMYSLWACRNRLRLEGYYFMEDVQNPATTGGKFGYDNTRVLAELREWQRTGKLTSEFLIPEQCWQISVGLEVVEIWPSLNEFAYLGVFRRRL